MSFDSYERSSFGARPQALYEFSLGSAVWRYVASEVDATLSGLGTYTAIAIKDEGISESGSPDNDDVKIQMSRQSRVAEIMIPTPPGESVFVTMRRRNYGSDEAPVIWVGTIKSVQIIDLNVIELTARVMAASLDRQGLRLAWNRSCPHALYDKNCTVDPNVYARSITIDSLSGSMIYSNNISNVNSGSFVGGYVEFPRHGIIERRAIDAQTGPSFTLLEGTDGIEVGSILRAYPGCPRTIEGCKSYNNLSNYGGFPHMPGKSPFDGNPVF